MRETKRLISFSAVAAAVILLCGAAGAQTPADLLKRFEEQARATGFAFDGFSRERGQAFFNATHGNEWSCASCHTGHPLDAGRHARTGKPIAPLAPAANPERFTDAATVDKWFRRNCNDVLGRACNAQEKGDVLQYLESLE